MTKFPTVGFFAVLIPALALAVAAPNPGAPAPGASTQPALQDAALTSKPFVKDGLQVTVTLGKAAFAVDEPLKFSVQFKNVSDKGFPLLDAAYFWRWTIQFQDERDSGPWQVMLWQLVPTWEEQGSAIKTLRPGDVLEVPVTLDPAAAEYRFIWAGPARPKGEKAPRSQLQAGTYSLTVAMEFQESLAQRDWGFPFWTGQVVTEPIKVSIMDKGDQPALETFKYAGTIAKVEGDKLVLKFGREPRQLHQETLLTSGKTTVTLDGKAAKLSDLQEGQAAVVTYTQGAAKPGEEPTQTATKIEATSGQ